MIRMKDIVREGHPVLRETAQEIKMPPSQEDIRILKEMQQFLANSQDPELSEKYNLRAGVGLAAPQINISKRMIAIRLEEEDGKEYLYSLINPKIISHSVEKSYLTAGEGCLSVDRDVPGYVPRHARITLKGYDIEREREVKLRLKGMPAIVFQHEMDHLNGIMFYDHINEDDPFKAPEGAIPIDR
ncbi:peptide deformylase [Lederbergia galactosidilytica]|uniref:Peptide deformylase n=1 Tax=Lederbergia galactosidilytica TaxID=217031 RepID=A0A177ZYF9_9BACI|nr:peptide deformylase [Lederbergia galactosidilytica]KRG16021.1 peptide deformylase [Virgibacillus soli]MBP1915586.1 peptide deformylase [Lederbergia galactosidilytica]OAK72975.1 peptide deformylase [Lederbergia galactosidilytica]